MAKTVARRFFSHSAVYALAAQFNYVAGFASLYFVSPALAEADFALFTLIMGQINLVKALNHLSVGVVLNNSFVRSRGQYRWLWSQLYGFLTLWNLVLAALVALVLWWVLPGEISGGERWLVIGLLCLPIALFRVTDHFGLRLAQMSQKPALLAWKNGISGVLVFFGNIITILLLGWGYLGWLVTQFVLEASCLFFVPVLLSYRIWPLLRFKWRTIRKQLGICMPLIPHQYSGIIMESSDRLVMDYYQQSDEQIGQIGEASKFGRVFSGIAMGLNQATTPFMYRFLAKSEYTKMRSLGYLNQVALLFITMVACLWLREVFGLIYRGKSEVISQGYIFGLIYIMGFNARPAYTGVMVLFAFFERNTLLLQVSIPAVLLNVVANLILVPYYGGMGAAISSFLAMSLMGYLGFFLPAYRRMVPFRYYPERSFALFAAGCLLVFLAYDADLWVKALLTALMMAGMAWGYFYAKKLLPTEKDF